MDGIKLLVVIFGECCSPASVSATVFDHQNGTYEAMALLVEPGNYSVRAYLDYSLCDGLRDPPENWSRLGKYYS